jgi:hypothetical protein
MSMTFLEMPEERKAHWYFHPWFAELLQLFYLDMRAIHLGDTLGQRCIEIDR